MLRSDSAVAVWPLTRPDPGARFHRNRLILAGRDQKLVNRTTVAEPGTIRRFTTMPVNVIGGAPPFSWSANGFDPSTPPQSKVSNPLRFLITTRNVLTVGNQLSRPMRRPAVPPRVSHTAPSLVMAGNAGYAPVLRVRVPSFGSRIPALNAPGIPGSEQ